MALHYQASLPASVLREIGCPDEAQSMKSEDLYDKGYKLALQYGPAEYPKGYVSSYFLHGFDCGLRDLYNNLPSEVHHQLQIINTLLQSCGQADFHMQLTTTPLVSSGRRAVHVLMQVPVKQKLLKIHTIGDKTAKWRRMRLQLSSTPSPR